MGGFEPAPTRKFATESYLNTELSYSRLESNVSKDQAVRWFKPARAFHKVKANKSYTQALVSNVSVALFAYLGVTDKSKLGIVGNNQCYSSANTVASAQKTTHVKLPSKNQSQPPGERVAVKMSNLTKIRHTTWPDGSVHGVVTEKPDILSNNRFHVLQHLDATDPLVADTNTRNSMQNMSGCITKPKLAMQVKNKMVGKNGFFDGECNMISDLGVITASQNTPKDCPSMHQAIRQHMQTRNSEPQYSDSNMEFLSNVEYDAPYDHMFHQSGFQQNTKYFGFLPKSALKTYMGEVVQWDDIPHILQAHQLIRDSKLTNFLHCCIPVQSGLNIKAWRHYLSNYWDNYVIYLSLDFL